MNSVERQQLALKYIPLANSMARPHRRRFPQHSSEFKAVANLALVEAASRYDPTRNTHFSTYVKPRIRGALLDMYRSMGLRGFRRNPKEAPSLYAIDDLMCEQTREASPEAAYESQDFVLNVLKRLPEPQEAIFKSIYLDGMSLKDIADKLKVPTRRVSYLHTTGLERLRRFLGAGVS